MLTQKVAQNFHCSKCDYTTSRKYSFEKHLLTDKHRFSKRVNIIEEKVAKSCKSDWICSYCDMKYKSRVGLWKHKVFCKIIYEKSLINIESSTHSHGATSNCEIQINNKEVTPEVIIELIKQNKELQQSLIDQNKTIMDILQKGGGTNNSFNNNKTFNLQIFLNETCKDAINLTDFVNQIQLSVNDLEETGKLGYAEGISKVFIKNLNGIDFTKRPIHCSDSKREILYIKEDDQWSKDDEQKSNLTNAIKKVANKNIKQISEWQKKNPEYSDPDSKQNDKYMKIVLNSMSGSTKEESHKNYEKIAKNIAKEVVINKIP